MNIVILAAGEGKRMRSALPKVLHLLAGQPLLCHVLDTARALQPAKIVVVVGHGAQAVQQAVAMPEVEFVIQEQQLGTGHAVQQALPLLDHSMPVLVLYGDVPLMSVSTLERLMRQASADPNAQRCAILTAKLAEPSGYGRIVREPTGRVVRIVEQKDASPEECKINEVNTGIMLLPGARIAHWLADLNNYNAQHEYYLTDVIERAIADKVEVVTTQPDTVSETMGVNNKLQLALLERIYQRQLADALLDEGVTLADPARIDIRGALTCGREVSIDVNCVFEGTVQLADDVSIGPHCVLKNAVIDAGAKIHAFTHIEGAHIGARAVIGPYARLRPGAILAEDTHIGNFVEIKNAMLGTGSKANHLSYIGDATVGAHVNLGAGTITCNYDGAQKHRTVIEDNVFVGSATQLVAPVKIAQGVTIAAGTTIWKDVPAGTLALNEKTQIAKADYVRPSKRKD